MKEILWYRVDFYKANDYVRGDIYKCKEIAGCVGRAHNRNDPHNSFILTLVYE